MSEIVNDRSNAVACKIDLIKTPLKLMTLIKITEYQSDNLLNLLSKHG